MAVIGIDLGTTNSLVCVFRNGKAELIPNKLGSFLTPSCVGFADDKETILVGQAAKDRLITHPELTVASFKRSMGTKRTLLRRGGKYWSATELSSILLRYLKENAEEYLGEEIEEAVISVPAYFDDRARSATKAAGELAGLKIERLVNEPSAAALAHRKGEDKPSSFLVFDFGGGTLDVSVADSFDNIIEIVAVAGDTQLGGNDIDAALANAFLEENGLVSEDVSPGEYAMILRAAEQCKIALNTLPTAVMSMPIDGKECSTLFTNEKLAKICAPLFRRMERTVLRALSDARPAVTNLDEVILVGGSSKMVSVRGYLADLLHVPLRTDVEPDLAVALGTGIKAGIKRRDKDIRDVILTDICPFSLGVNVINHLDGGRALFSPIIPRNTTLPASRIETYSNAADNQSVMNFIVYQGDNLYCDENLKLGGLTIDVPPGSKAGTVRCDVRFTYDINGILDVDVHCITTGEKKNLLIVGSDVRLSPEEIARKCEELEKLKILPQDEEENAALLARAERVYAEVNPMQRPALFAQLQAFMSTLSIQNSLLIRQEREKLESLLELIEFGEQEAVK